jgi:predicted nucleic acid-binding protein
VVNASPVILLGQVGQLDLLQLLGLSVVIPEAAMREVTCKGAADPAVQALGKVSWLATVGPDPIPASVAAYGLGDGETAVLAHALANPGSGVILDDRAARNAAAALGLVSQGTLAVVLFAKAHGAIAAARPLVEQLRQHGMYLSDQLMNKVLAKVGE